MSIGQARDVPPGSRRRVRARAVDERWTRSAGAQLLVVDPCAEGRDDLVSRLGSEGVTVTWCQTATDGLIEFGRLDPDAVVVATVLDGLDSAEYVKAVRRHDSRLVLVALDADAPDAAGPMFLAGAMAAVARPYDAAEVMGRLSTYISDLDARARITFGSIELDPRAYEVRVAGSPVDGLPSKEFELLRVLMMNANNVVSTDTIREALWGTTAEAPSSNAVAVHAARLRTRLGEHARLTRVRGRGYRLSHS